MWAGHGAGPDAGAVTGRPGRSPRALGWAWPDRRSRGRRGPGEAQSRELLRRAPSGDIHGAFVSSEKEGRVRIMIFQGNEFQVILCHSSPGTLSLSQEY